jgi:adenosylmethionine-8-amino-7-oxononanoate aminotransferase
LGCVPAVSGYFRAVKAVCDRYGALLILDEVMSGMGRSGTLHAWQGEDVVPDLQTIGKGLGGGFLPIAGLLIGSRVVDTLFSGSGSFMHGHTYQGHPVICAAALEVQRQIRQENLTQNVAKMGKLLETKLKDRLSGHRHVGDIRGKGLFWGVSDKNMDRFNQLLMKHRLNLSRTRQPRNHLIQNLELVSVFTREVRYVIDCRESGI